MELPELTVLSQQMTKELVGRRVVEVEVANPKCLNMPLNEFRNGLVGRAVESVKNRGKWLLINLGAGTSSSSVFDLLLFNPGMGADVIRFGPDEGLQEKHHIKIGFDDRSGFTVRVWWFCYLHLVSSSKLKEHRFVGHLGKSPLDEEFTLPYFRALLEKRKGRIKNFLVDQKNVAGIGNVYIQDILFNSKLHPTRRISTMNAKEIEALYHSMRSVLQESIAMGGLAYERNFFGDKGGFGADQFKIAYKLGRSCPICQTPIEKIKTGATSSFICPKCQKQP
ncbi:MAG: Fpg/Nei family DNA glycosylase [Candidatus Bathyarchaeota archaeon]|nr:MAG: Fpg/Nei family DNA glycosylase [Candidatus Bathyarchaeota archaeon]